MTEKKQQSKWFIWFHKTFDGFLKVNKIFQVTTICALAFFSYQTKVQSLDIEALTVTNAYLLSESMSDNAAMNESPFVWWKKEIDPDTEVIIMRDYNDAFYKYFLEQMKVDRFYYVRKTDFAVFNYEEAAKFYDEDLNLYLEFINQEENKHGVRPMIIKEYKTEFTNLDGEVNKGGYWRYVREDKGHIYIYGRMKQPILM